MSDDRAGPGEIFVCGACGKTSLTRYGFEARNGWDASCMANAVLCRGDSLVKNEHGRVVKAIAVDEGSGYGRAKGAR